MLLFHLQELTFCSVIENCLCKQPCKLVRHHFRAFEVDLVDPFLRELLLQLLLLGHLLRFSVVAFSHVVRQVIENSRALRDARPLHFGV